MRTRWILFSTLLLLLGAWSCTPRGAFAPPIPTPGNVWSMTLTQTGGFAGVHLGIRVSSDGVLMAEDKRSSRSVSKPVSQATLRKLTLLMANVAPPESSPPPSICADCFAYDLEIALGAGSVRVRTDDVQLKESGAQELILFLVEMRDGALGTAN